MKKFVLALLSALVFVSPAFATVGGPWSGGIPGNTTTVNPSNPLGTFQGTIKGKNFTGLMTFVSGTNGGQVVVSSSTARTNWSGFSLSGSNVSVATIDALLYIVTTKTVDTTGFGSFFFEGKSGSINLNCLVDTGSRSITGMVEGAGSRAQSLILWKPATSTTPLTMYTVDDELYMDGTFSAKLSSNWAANSFSGKGYLAVTKFDAAAAQADLNANSSLPVIDHIVTVPLAIKVSGLKTSDSVPSTFTPPLLTPTLPSVTGTTTVF